MLVRTHIKVLRHQKRTGNVYIANILPLIL